MTMRLCAILVAAVTSLPGAPWLHAEEGSLAEIVRATQPKVVKIYGAGGVRGLEAYQSGFLISPPGNILTVFSYVLDTDEITVVLDDGRRFTATLVGADPVLEIAVLKIDAQDLTSFRLEEAVSASVGDRVLALANVYGIATGNESASVLKGIVSAVTPLDARRGTFATPYRGPVYILDAMTNNAGAAGGALTDHQGRLLGMLGKELRSAQTNTWLNYALPIHELVPSIQQILEGKSRTEHADSSRRPPPEPHTLDGLGIVLIPDVLSKTPPFIEQVRAKSPAERAGLKPDDLIVFVAESLVESRSELIEQLSLIDRLDPVPLTILRGDQLIAVELKQNP